MDKPANVWDEINLQHGALRKLHFQVSYSGRYKYTNTRYRIQIYNTRYRIKEYREWIVQRRMK